jgi:serine/threonine protein kinase
MKNEPGRRKKAKSPITNSKFPISNSPFPVTKSQFPIPDMNMVGQLLDRRYRVVQILSSGAFGQTYLAVDTRRPGQTLNV